MEPIIHEAYGLLTGNKTRESGLWTIQDEKNPLQGITVTILSFWTVRSAQTV